MDQTIELAAAPARLSLGEKLLVAVALYFLALKLVYAFNAGPIADEAYYWLWGRHFSIGYFDHPPLLGWLNGIIYSVLGRSLFALRLPSLLALAAALFIFYDVARRIGGDKWRLVFLKSTVIYLASPLFGFYGSVVFVDYLLVIMVMASGYFFIRFFADFEETGRGRAADIVAAALFLGCAGLTKFTGGFLGLAVAGAVLTRRPLWPLLRRWEIYAAAAIALGMQLPQLLFQLQQGFATFQFHAVDRFDGARFTGFDVSRMKATVLDTMGMLSPFLVPVIVSFFIRRQRDRFQRVGKTLAIWTFWLSSLLFLYIANFATVLWWWNAVAFVLVMAFTGRYMDRISLGLHAVYGLVINSVSLLSYAVLPVSLLAGMAPIMESQSTHGWNQTAAALAAAKSQHGAAFIASNRYQTASQIAFALDDKDVAELSPRHTAFDDWFDFEAYRGKDAIVLFEARDDEEYWRTRFERVTPIGEVRIERFGYLLNTYRLFLGEGFIGSP